MFDAVIAAGMDTTSTINEAAWSGWLDFNEIMVDKNTRRRDRS